MVFMYLGTYVCGYIDVCVSIINESGQELEGK